MLLGKRGEKKSSKVSGRAFINCGECACMGQILKELEDLRKGNKHKIHRCADMERGFFAKHVYTSISKVFNVLTHLKILRSLYVKPLERKWSQRIARAEKGSWRSAF